MNDTWRDHDVVRDEADLRRCLDLIGDIEAEWSQLESRVDFGADHAREAIRARLPGFYVKPDLLARRIAVAQEREKIVNAVLSPLHTQKLAALKRRFEAVVATAAVPTEAEFRDFAGDSHELDTLTAVLFEATGLDEFRRGFDGLARLKSAWFDANRSRAKLFHLVGPENKPRPREAAWLDQARRLTELRAAGTAPKEKEDTHVTR